MVRLSNFFNLSKLSIAIRHFVFIRRCECVLVRLPATNRSSFGWISCRPSEPNSRNWRITRTTVMQFDCCLLGTIIRNLFNRWWILRIRVDFSLSLSQFYRAINIALHSLTFRIELITFVWFLYRLFRSILESGASVNIYMFFGGTNFGFTAGERAHLVCLCWLINMIILQVQMTGAPANTWLT